LLQKIFPHLTTCLIISLVTTFTDKDAEPIYGAEWFLLLVLFRYYPRRRQSQDSFLPPFVCVSVCFTHSIS